ncbi:hypothetical protein LCGC14_0264390 [marine sediment metagenome]|uniref:Uncharacterized protein n=1 Tax=marine sediment metagenome TaxID=412755 RepID=A0A0F9UHQ7_9ZZZZ
MNIRSVLVPWIVNAIIDGWVIMSIAGIIWHKYGYGVPIGYVSATLLGILVRIFVVTLRDTHKCKCDIERIVATNEREHNTSSS